MIQDQIEHVMLVEAPVDVVWRIVTEPDQIVQWFSDAAEIEPRAGGAGKLVFGDPSSIEAKVQPFFVETYEPTTRFSFRWCHENSDDRDTKSLLVDFTLTAEGEGTRVRMVESGHDTRWNADVAQQQYDEHVNGWNILLPRLVDLAKREG